jgi:hypothetical protein
MIDGIIRIVQLIKQFFKYLVTKPKSVRPHKRSWWSRNWLNTIFLSFAILLGFGVIFALMYGYNSYLTVMHTTDAAELAKWGTFGDYVGGLSGSIFNFFSFVLLLLTILLQIQEMRYSREELERSAKALNRQGKLQRHQNFENTFFQLLQLHHHHANTLICDEKAEALLGGRQCFDYFYQNLKRIYQQKKTEFVFSPNLSYLESEQELIRKVYKKFYTENQEKLGHYFRNIYHIIRFVENNHPKDEDEQTLKNYIIILRSQFSSHELVLIVYHCLFLWYDYGEPGFFEAIEKYLLLEDLQKNLLFKRMHYDFFPKNVQHNPWHD